MVGAYGFSLLFIGGKTIDEWSKTIYPLLDQWTNDQKFLEQTQRVLNWLNLSKQHIDSHQNVQNFLKKRKYIYPDMMALRVGLQSKLAHVTLLHQKFSCNIEPLQYYLELRKEFLDYVKNDKTFKKMSLKEKRQPKALVDYGHNSLLLYIFSHYCGIEEKKLTYKNQIEHKLDFDILTYETKKILKRIENER